MFYDRYELKTKRKTHYKACLGQTTVDSGFTIGDLIYARDNGFIHGFIVDDDAFWRLDDDGNWPEAI